MKISQATRIPAHRFTFDKYCGRQGVSVFEIFESGFDELQTGATLIGYCLAKDLTVRPRESGFALMVQLPEGEDVWCHVSEYWFEE